MNHSTTEKQFKIIKIIDEYNVIIDAGTQDGITNAELFEVYIYGKDITVDDINYGALNLLKATLRVKQVFPKMCLCENNNVIQVNKLNFLNSFVMDEIAPLPIDKNCIDKELNSLFKNKLLKVGDIAEKYNHTQDLINTDNELKKIQQK